MDRAPGLSVRLKLTLSYASFLMVAGALLLAATWVYLTHARHVGLILEPSYEQAVLRRFAPTAAIVMAFLLVLGLLGGWLLAGRMLAPLDRITDATRIAATGSLSHRIRYTAAETSSANSPTPSTPCSRSSKHTSPNSRDSRRCPLRELRTPLAVTETLSRRRPRRSPATTTAGELVDHLHAVNPERSTSPKRCSCSAAPTNDLHREHADLSLVAEEASRNAPPPRRKTSLSHRSLRDATQTIGSPRSCCR